MFFFSEILAGPNIACPHSFIFLIKEHPHTQAKNKSARLTSPYTLQWEKINPEKIKHQPHLPQRSKRLSRLSIVFPILGGITTLSKKKITTINSNFHSYHTGDNALLHFQTKKDKKVISYILIQFYFDSYSFSLEYYIRYGIYVTEVAKKFGLSSALKIIFA